MIQTLNYQDTTVGNLEPKLKKAFNLLNEYSQDCRSRFYEAKIQFEEKQFRNYIERANDPEDRTPQYLAKAFEFKLQRIGMFKLQWLKEAQLDFDNKLVKMATKLVDFGMMEEGVVLDTDNIDIDEHLGMEFYVTAIKKEGYQRMGRAHARFVWVECYEKASHYRFIVTYKKDKNYNPVIEQEHLDAVNELMEVCSEVPPTGSRKEQVAFYASKGLKATQIANKLGANVSYVRKLMRDLKEFKSL